jgi:hypothetical protein
MPPSCKPGFPRWRLPRDNQSVDYRKFDGPLAKALDQTDRAAAERLPVFVRTQPQLSEDARTMLAASGIQAGAEDATVFAADLSHEQVAALSREPWVTAIHLASKTRPYG